MATNEFSTQLNLDGVSVKVLRAAHFAADKHKFQKRKGDGSSYIIHPLGVAWSLYEAGVVDVDVVVAAVLHDTVEDTDCSLDEIEEVFGSRVRGIVAEVTDDKSLGKGFIQFSIFSIFSIFNFFNFQFFQFSIFSILNFFNFQLNDIQIKFEFN
jgi:(p)ppGpp synthase/HD superfamily hydrolase